MFKRSTIFAALATLVVLTAPAAAADAREDAFRKMFRDYEQIRLALVDDSLDSIPERAGAISIAALAAEEAAKKTGDYPPCCTAPEATRQWIDYTNPSGFTGNACYTGGCGRASHANGCGGMSESNIVL